MARNGRVRAYWGLAQTLHFKLTPAFRKEANYVPAFRQFRVHTSIAQ